MKRKICVVTGSRAEYGLLRLLMQKVIDDPNLILQTIVTGMHLSLDHGNTYLEIEDDGFLIDRKVPILCGLDTPVGVARSMGIGISDIAVALDELKPDLVVLLGDRFEVFAAASAALIAKIPVVHIHGGELTGGNFDDSLRHSISKMSHLHFVAAEEYRSRVIQLGEHPDRVFNVGGLGIDVISKVDLMSRKQIEESTRYKFQDLNLLVTFHPVTLEIDLGVSQLTEMLEALNSMPDVGLMFSSPNADTNGSVFSDVISDYIRDRKNAAMVKSLGSRQYISCIAQFDGVIGNSSSGLLEAPSLNKGSIDIGNRQKGRLASSSVIRCEPIRSAICHALEKLFSDEFSEICSNTTSVYGTPGAAERIHAVISTIPVNGLVRKTFYDALMVPYE